MKCSLTSALLGALVVHLLAENDQPEVTTPLGKIKGYYNSSFHGRTFRAFEGIPYAKPPVGELRFEPPERFGPWSGALIADRPPSFCPQFLGNGFQGSEDCLFLNIYTNVPENSTELFPVIFFIHGGGFTFIGSSVMRPEYLMDRDVVLVTMNYRLGPLGFLSTGDEIVPGNMGLKDQSLALRWVSENIEYFGGDRAKITLAGSSAGGASVHYHYLSPLSRGLFHAGMSFSGTALNCWAQSKAPVEKAKKLADTLGCPTGNSKDLVKCLKTIPAKSIVKPVSDFMAWLDLPVSPFAPVTEVTTNHTFIDRSAVDIITSGDTADVPWLTTVVSGDGLYPANEFITNDELLKQLDTDWELIAPYLLDYNDTIPKFQHASVADKIRKHYLGNSKIDRSTAESLIHMISHRLFHADAEKAARLMARSNKSPVWFYLYDYRAEFSFTDFNFPDDFGAAHTDDVYLVIRQTFFPLVTRKSTLEVQNILLNIWSSIALKGSPDIGIDWPRVDPDAESFRYLKISGPEALEVVEDTNFAEKAFWGTIDFNENKPNSSTRVGKN